MEIEQIVNYLTSVWTIVLIVLIAVVSIVVWVVAKLVGGMIQHFIKQVYDGYLKKKVDRKLSAINLQWRKISAKGNTGNFSVNFAQLNGPDFDPVKDFNYNSKR